MKEFFCGFYNFFRGNGEKTQGEQEDAQEKGRQGGGALRHKAAGTAQRQEIEKPTQEHPQQHEQPETAPAGDAAQEEKQHRRQERIGEIKEELQPLQPGAAQKGRHKLVEKAQRRAAGQAQQRLDALLAGIDAHQPSSFPRKPRRRSRSSA